MAVSESRLAKSPADSITALDDRYLESMLQQDICASEAGQSCADDAYVWF